MELRSRLAQMGFAAKMMHKAGLLPARSPDGVLRFALAAGTARLGPHLTLLLHAVNRPDAVALNDNYRRPRLVEFVAGLPRTPSGKVVKRAGRDRHTSS